MIYYEIIHKLHGSLYVQCIQAHFLLLWISFLFNINAQVSFFFMLYFNIQFQLTSQ